MASSFKDDLRYTLSDCFETFPFPENYQTDEALEKAGIEYYDFRAATMVRHNQGLTETSNRFHRPDDQNPDIVRLRQLHSAMDSAVLGAYGWGDLDSTCEFFPEFDEEDEDDSSRSGRTRQAKFRYRWPEEIHDQVLARLLALNIERASQQDVPQQALQNLPPRATATRKPKMPAGPLLFEG